jgi:hypothetical protein
MKRMVVAALVMAAMLGGLFCGGSTGREGLPQQLATGEPNADGAADSTVGATIGSPDTGAFDVVILFADRGLPDVAAPPSDAGTAEGGAGGYPWPDCPPWVPVTNGVPTPLAQAFTLIPAEYDDAGDVLLTDAGKVLPDPDGSPCATYPWLGSTKADNCLVSSGSAEFVPFPPCNWCVNAGTAVQGPGAGEARYDLCIQLYQCMVRTGCGQRDVPGVSLAASGGCLCGTNTADCDANGPCAKEELAAMESLSDPASLGVTQLAYTSGDPKMIGYCGKFLNNVYLTAFQTGCFRGDGGP